MGAEAYTQGTSNNIIFSLRLGMRAPIPPTPPSPFVV